MNEEGSGTFYLRQLKAGDQAALQKLWEGYFARLVGLARKRLRGAPPQVVDADDVALRAFNNFFGEFPDAGAGKRRRTSRSKSSRAIRNAPRSIIRLATKDSVM